MSRPSTRSAQWFYWHKIGWILPIWGQCGNGIQVICNMIPEWNPPTTDISILVADDMALPIWFQAICNHFAEPKSHRPLNWLIVTLNICWHPSSVVENGSWLAWMHSAFDRIGMVIIIWMRPGKCAKCHPCICGQPLYLPLLLHVTWADLYLGILLKYIKSRPNNLNSRYPVGFQYSLSGSDVV